MDPARPPRPSAPRARLAPLWAPVLACLSLALGCGARSDLSAFDGQGGSGAGPTSGGGGTGGQTTTGSTTTSTTDTTTSTTTTTVTVDPLTCAKLVIDGLPLSPSPVTPDNKQALPWIARTQADSSGAALVYPEDPAFSGPPFPIGSVPVSAPWGAWPASLGATAIHLTTTGFVVGHGREGTFSLFTTDEPNNMGVPSGMVMWAPKPGVGGANGQFFDDVPPGYPVIAAANAGHFLAGHVRVLGGILSHLSLARVTIGDPKGSFLDPAACAQGGLTGGAIPLGQGYLALVSSGRPFGTCLQDDLPDGPPSRVQLVSLPPDLPGAKLLFEHDEPQTQVSQARVIEAPGGAWAAWERVPFQPPFVRRIQLLQLGADGLPLTGEVVEVSYGNVALPFAVAGLGSSLALAGVELDPAGAKSLVVRVLEPDGGPIGAIALFAEDGFELDPNVSILPSPAGDKLLISWAESSAINNDVRRVRLARIACSGP